MNKPIYLFVTPFFPTPESWRGAFCYDFVRALIKTNKYDVRVFVPGSKGQGDYEYHGIQVYRFRNYQPFPGGFCRFFAYPFSRAALEAKVKALGIGSSEIAVYHAHDVSLVPYSYGLKHKNPAIRVLLHFHNGGHPFTLGCGRFGVIPVYSTIYYLYLRWCFEQVDVPIFVSERQRQHFGVWYRDGFLKKPVNVLDGVLFGRWIRPVRLRNVKVLHNGIDYDVFNKEGRIGHDDFVIGCVGNVDEAKDQMTLLRAVVRIKADIPNLKVIIIGSGVMLECCQSFVESNGLRSIVEFKKEVDHLKLPEFYKTLDLFVIPSYLEGFCCSYMEAYGCGTPVIGCKGVCLDEAIVPEEQDKWLIEPQDDIELARLILNYYRNPSCQHMIHDYNINRMVGDFVKQLQV